MIGCPRPQWVNKPSCCQAALDISQSLLPPLTLSPFSCLSHYPHYPHYPYYLHCLTLTISYSDTGA